MTETARSRGLWKAFRWPVGFLAAAAVAFASPGRSVHSHWQALTRADVDAAYALIENNHPAALPIVGDVAFRTALAAAHARALARAAKVTNYAGYLATLGEFAGSLGDGHIWSRPLSPLKTVEWAGVIAAKRGSKWVVANDDPLIAGAQLLGARILSCGNQPVETLARKILHFRGDVSVPAAEVLNAGWLLIDDGNPFLRRPSSCLFEQNGKRISLSLHWTRITRQALLHKYWKQSHGHAGFGVAQTAGGFWIGIQRLTPQAQAVLDVVKARATAIRSAPYVVVDLRGDFGGDDAYGRALAEDLYGKAYVDSILGPNGLADGCFPVFRASPGNRKAIALAAVRFQKSGDSEGAKDYREALRLMNAAAAAGHSLTGAPSCKPPVGIKVRRGKPLVRGKVFILTDAACFSSCIQTVGYFRKLGAIQVGQATGADTHYSEVREVVLPSGLSAFSTLQAIMTGQPRKIGPYSPQFEFEGNIADTGALEKWIEGLAGGSRSPAAPRG